MRCLVVLLVLAGAAGADAETIVASITGNITGQSETLSTKFGMGVNVAGSFYKTVPLVDGITTFDANAAFENWLFGTPLDRPFDFELPVVQGKRAATYYARAPIASWWQDYAYTESNWMMSYNIETTKLIDSVNGLNLVGTGFTHTSRLVLELSGVSTTPAGDIEFPYYVHSVNFQLDVYASAPEPCSFVLFVSVVLGGCVGRVRV